MSPTTDALGLVCMLLASMGIASPIPPELQDFKDHPLAPAMPTPSIPAVTVPSLPPVPHFSVAVDKPSAAATPLAHAFEEPRSAGDGMQGATLLDALQHAPALTQTLADSVHIMEN